MSISGVSSSDVLQTSPAQAAQTKFQQIQSQFQKVGQDLQSGNLSQAQADFAKLSQELPSGQQTGGSTATGSTTTGPTSTIAKAFQTLGQDLQAGNLAASQTDFAAIQQDAQQQNSGQAQGHHHHHHGGGVSQQTGSTLQQDVTALGTALQSGNLSSAQQAYATFQTDFQQAFPNSSAAGSTGTTSTTNAAGTGGVNVTA
jgi:hypothetical protein